MFSVMVHRLGGVTVPMGPYPTHLEAVQARAEFVNGKREAGWKIAARGITTFLRGGSVKLEVWIERVNYDVN